MDIRYLINRKRHGHRFSPGEMAELVAVVAKGSCPDEQLGALAMVICLQGLDPEETRLLTDLMARSGSQLARREEGVVRLDKHSTGGVGDKVSLALAPMVAACGAHVPMVSGRGLLHTGGTLDKLEAIPGFRVDLSPAEMNAALAKVGFFIVSATADLAPADRRLYAIRDMTDTVESIPLITASILSKKLVEDLDGLVMDVKVGQGSFMGDQARAEELAQSIVSTAAALGLPTVALLTAMDEPLGRAVGNALEVQEVIELLRGQGSADLLAVTLALGVDMLLAGNLAGNEAAARARLEATITGGGALAKFQEFVAVQGGDPRIVDTDSHLPRAALVLPGKAPGAGFLTGIDPLVVGRAVMELGAGRRHRDDSIDPSCGVVFHHKVGATVAGGEPVFQVHAPTRTLGEEAVARILEGMTWGQGVVEPTAMVLAKIGRLK